MPARWGDNARPGRSLHKQRKISCHVTGTVRDCYCYIIPLFRKHCSKRTVYKNQSSPVQQCKYIYRFFFINQWFLLQLASTGHFLSFCCNCGTAARGGFISVNQSKVLSSLPCFLSTVPQGSRADRRVWRRSATKASPERKLMPLFRRSRSMTSGKQHLRFC